VEGLIKNSVLTMFLVEKQQSIRWYRNFAFRCGRVTRVGGTNG